MKKISFLIATAFCIQVSVFAQQMEPKERAAFIAKEEFSKSKYRKVEKYGITKEKSKVIISTPVIKQDIKEYAGVYKANGHDYMLTLNIEDEKKITGTIKEPAANNNYATFTLKNISIDNALFKAVKVSGDGTETPLEGVFIDKSDDGVVEFGLGLKLLKSITINKGANTDKLFLKKVE
ncbi:MAG: hypothetical protein JWQ09_1170 [Segetibacter sp.]|nr:hypothetical protein [Segetibacter sp.]